MPGVGSWGLVKLHHIGKTKTHLREEDVVRRVEDAPRHASGRNSLVRVPDTLSAAQSGVRPLERDMVRIVVVVPRRPDVHRDAVLDLQPGALRRIQQPLRRRLSCMLQRRAVGGLPLASICFGYGLVVGGLCGAREPRSRRRRGSDGGYGGDLPGKLPLPNSNRSLVDLVSLRGDRHSISDGTY